MDLLSRINDHFEESIAVKKAAAPLLAAPLARAVQMLVTAFQHNKKLLICGNGGSAADSQHLAAELVGRFEVERQGFSAIALTTDTSILTALANDYRFDQVYARQVQALGREQDILLGISTSGNSPNILAAIEVAHAHRMQVIAFTGHDGGKIGQLLGKDDVHLCVPAERTSRIQEVHLVLLHALCDGTDSLLSGDPHV